MVSYRKVFIRFLALSQLVLLLTTGSAAFAAEPTVTGVVGDGIKLYTERSDGSFMYVPIAGGIDEPRIITEIGTDNSSFYTDNCGSYFALKANGDVWGASTSSTNEFTGRGVYTQTVDESANLSNWGKLNGLSGVKKIETGSCKTYAIDGNDNLWAWGFGVDYWTTPGYAIDSSVPINYSGRALTTGNFSSTILDVSATSGSMIALTTDNLLYTWTGSSLPLLVANLPAGKTFTSVFASNGTYFAIASDNSLYSMGNNGQGEMLDGNTNNNPSEELTVADQTGLPSGEYFVRFANNGNGANFGVTNTGNVYGWGYNTSSGKLGTNVSTDRTSLPIILSNLANIVDITDGSYGLFALTSSGVVYFWGLQDTPAENIPRVYDGIYNLETGGTTTTTTSTPLPASGIQLYLILVAALVTAGAITTFYLRKTKTTN